MDYKNKFYKTLRKMSVYCENCDCDDCIFYMEETCCIKKLFQKLSLYNPDNFDEVYIRWYKEWEAKYNELYE